MLVILETFQGKILKLGVGGKYGAMLGVYGSYPGQQGWPWWRTLPTRSMLGLIVLTSTFPKPPLSCLAMPIEVCLHEKHP